MGYYGNPGIQVTPQIEGDKADVTIACRLENTPDGTPVNFSITGDGETSATVANGMATALLTISQVRLWDGLNDPFLYKAVAELPNGDKVETLFGCRTFSFDPDKDFF